MTESRDESAPVDEIESSVEAARTFLFDEFSRAGYNTRVAGERIRAFEQAVSEKARREAVRELATMVCDNLWRHLGGRSLRAAAINRVFNAALEQIEPYTPAAPTEENNRG